MSLRTQTPLPMPLQGQTLLQTLFSLRHYCLRHTADAVALCIPAQVPLQVEVLWQIPLQAQTHLQTALQVNVQLQMETLITAPARKRLETSSLCTVHFLLNTLEPAQAMAPAGSGLSSLGLAG